LVLRRLQGRCRQEAHTCGGGARSARSQRPARGPGAGAPQACGGCAVLAACVWWGCSPTVPHPTPQRLCRPGTASPEQAHAPGRPWLRKLPPADSTIRGFSSSARRPSEAAAASWPGVVNGACEAPPQSESAAK
jgi:hypothetical protein